MAENQNRTPESLTLTDEAEIRAIMAYRAGKAEQFKTNNLLDLDAAEPPTPAVTPDQDKRRAVFLNEVAFAVAGRLVGDGLLKIDVMHEWREGFTNAVDAIADILVHYRLQ